MRRSPSLGPASGVQKRALNSRTPPTIVGSVTVITPYPQQAQREGPAVAAAAVAEDADVAKHAAQLLLLPFGVRVALGQDFH
ncbi:hypothetical protein OG747_52860 (plasmid) [Streptomyces sp. NBC_01384]|uniref:hypothetical protein n=1 Tax=Streptomyces sp. NBC_01384 TaxID=2903847 RepID=UPI00324412A3